MIVIEITESCVLNNIYPTMIQAKLEVGKFLLGDISAIQLLKVRLPVLGYCYCCLR